VRDIAYAIRGLYQSAAFSLVAILSLAIGIGASTAVGTEINAVFFRPLPVDDPATLRTLSWSSPKRAFANRLFRGPSWDARLARGEGIESFPHGVFQDIRDRASGFSDVACWRNATEALTETGVLNVHAVSGSYLRTLGVAAIRGRAIVDDDDRAGAPLVAMARDAALLGQTVPLHGHRFEVVGILPGDFAGLDPSHRADVIVPYSADALFPTFQRNDWSQCSIVARLKQGVSWEQARAEAELVVRQAILAAPPSESYELPRVGVDDLSARLRDVQRNVARPLTLLVSTVGILLLITCANIGGLLFARSRARQKELATRLALGGSRPRVMRQLVTESVVLAAIGGVAGVALAYALNPLLPRLLNELVGTSAIGLTLRPDARVLTLSIVLSIGCGLLFGLLPAFTATRIDPVSALKQASGVSPPSRVRAGKAALVVQLALAMIVIVGAGLLVRTMINLRRVPLGYTPDRLVFVETHNPVGRPRVFVEDTLAELKKIPGVTAASVSQWPIFNNTVLRFPFCIPGAEPALQQLDLAHVFPGFFETWGVQLVLGRDIDDSAQPGLVVNETFVKRFLPNRNPLGVMIGGGECPGRTQSPIVGVVADHIDRQRVERVPAVYTRYARGGALYVTTYALRTAGDERALIPPMRRVIAARAIATNGDARTGIEYRDGILRQERFLTMLLVFFASVALLISCLGVYGMLTYTVSWRTAEIGLRIAVGARPQDVVGMIVRESLLPAVLGITLGAGVALVLARSIESVLFGVSRHDPLTTAAAAAVLICAALVAAFVPARRASRIDPLPSLRCE
jgi:predicted permease